MTLGCVLLTTDVVGGVWDFAISQARELVASGTRSVLLALGEPSAAQRREASRAGAELIAWRLRLEWMQDSQADVAATQQRLRELVEVLRPDVVHANQFAAACARLSVPVVLTLHSDVLSWRRWTLADERVTREWQPYAALVRRALAQADEVVAVSRFLADQTHELYGTQRPVQVIHNGWSSPPTPIRPRPPRTLLAGRVWDAAKNLPLAIQALRGMRDPGEVLLAGEQKHPESGGQADVPPPVQPLGLLPREQLDSVLRRTRIYLSPAVYDPFGLLPLQAALAGCALLLSDIPSYREVWGDTALLCRPDDLGRQWTRLLEDDALCQHLARAAQRRALERYSAERMADGYRAVYTRVAAGVAA